jgi:NADH dehydrogenase
MPKRIVILGAGFAGIQAAAELDRKVGRSGEIEVTLISDQNYFLFTPLLPQIASSNIDQRHIAQAIRDLRGARKFRFLRASVKSIDLDRQEVHTDYGPSDQLSVIPIPYDYLIVAPGSRTDYF